MLCLGIKPEFELACSQPSHQPRPDADSMACRRDYSAQLQPVRGGDLRDQIRSELVVLEITKDDLAS